MTLISTWPPRWVGTYHPGPGGRHAAGGGTGTNFRNPQHRSPLALALVEDIQRLYSIEDAARHVSDAERHRLRQERSRAIIDRIGEQLDQAVAGRLPAADLGQAIDYTRKRWRQLRRFLTHGWLPIDNNPAENALRPW